MFRKPSDESPEISSGQVRLSYIPGSYFPPPVKEEEIPGKDGKIRKLGIPTISDRVGQMNSIFQLLRRRLVQWARKRYKRYKRSLNKAYEWLERIKKHSGFILPMAIRIFIVKRLDLYNKSRVVGDYQARFCERLGVRLPLSTRPAKPLSIRLKDK